MLVSQREPTAFEALHQERGVLYQLLERQPESLVLCDPAGRVVCMSSSARRLLENEPTRSDLDRAVTLALRRSRCNTELPGESPAPHSTRVRSANGSPLLVEFSWIEASDRCLWLLAQMRQGRTRRPPLEQLSRAETKVARLLVQGCSNAEISQLLNVSIETVKTHVQRILAKLGVNSRAKAAAMAREAWQTD